MARPRAAITLFDFGARYRYKLGGKVSLSSLYLAVENKSLPHYRVSGSGGNTRGKTLVRRSDLLAWLEAQKIEAANLPAGTDLPHLR